MPTDRRRLAVLLALSIALLLAGCSGLVPAPDTSPTAEATPTPTDGTASPTPATNGTMAVHVVNVGQASSTLVVGPTGETMLIDTGAATDDGEYVLDYLRRQGVERIDYLVTSHADADHVGGSAAVIEYYETEGEGVGAVYDPGIAASTATYRAYLDAIERHDVPLYETRAGDDIPFAGVDVDVLGPPEPYLDGGSRNENSLVLHLAYGETSVLVTGDAGRAGESSLVERYGSRLRSTVLIAGHHGSRGSTTPEFLSAVDPRLVVISSAYDSQYGHPHPETLDRLAARSIRTYWTATQGDVVLRSDGRRLTVATQRAAPTAPERLRDGDVDPVAPGSGLPVAPRVTLVDDGAVVPVDEAAVTPAATDGGTAEGLVVVTVHPDAAGDDRENLGDEYVVFANTGTEPLDLSGWTVADAAGATYAVPAGVTLEPGATVTLYTGAGTDTDAALYWNAGRPVWNNDGDTVVVRNASGDRILTEGYT